MLEVRNLTRLFSGIPAVDGVSFSAAPGAVTGYSSSPPIPPTLSAPASTGR